MLPSARTRLAPFGTKAAFVGLPIRTNMLVKGDTVRDEQRYESKKTRRAMEDRLDIDTAARSDSLPVWAHGQLLLSRREPARDPGEQGRRREQKRGQELVASEPIDIFHWAAVALVTALMWAVLGYAAGTPALSRAANVTSLVFGAIGGTAHLERHRAQAAGASRRRAHRELIRPASHRRHVLTARCRAIH